MRKGNLQRNDEALNHGVSIPSSLLTTRGFEFSWKWRLATLSSGSDYFFFQTRTVVSVKFCKKFGSLKPCSRDVIPPEPPVVALLYAGCINQIQIYENHRI